MQRSWSPVERFAPALWGIFKVVSVFLLLAYFARRTWAYCRVGFVAGPVAIALLRAGLDDRALVRSAVALVIER